MGIIQGTWGVLLLKRWTMQNKIQKLIHDHNIAKNRWPTGIKSIDAAHDLERERLKKEYEDYEKNVKETKKTNLLKLKKLRGYL